MSPKLVALRLMIASVGASAVLGILTLVSGGMGEFSGKVLASTVIVALGSVEALACGALWEREERSLLGLLGAGGTVLCSLAVLGTLWVVWGPRGVDTPKMIVDACILGTATAHLCLLSLARLAPRFAFALPVAAVVVYALAILLMVAIHTQREPPWVLIGVLSILAAGLSIVIPVFHILSREEIALPKSVGPEKTHLRCPACGTDVEGPLGERICPWCMSRFRIEILPPLAGSNPVTEPSPAGSERD